MENGLREMNAFLFVCSDKIAKPKANSSELDDAQFKQLAPTSTAVGKSSAVSITEIDDDQQEAVDLKAMDLHQQDEEINDDGSQWEDVIDGDENMGQSNAKERHKWVR